MAPHITANFPVRMDAYIEAYFGSGAVFFAAPRQWAEHEICNDINNNVTNFFEVLRDRRSELIRALNLTPHSRAELQNAKKKIQDKRIGNVERARCFFITIEQSFSNTQRGWMLPCTSNGTSRAARWRQKVNPARLDRIADRLQNASFENVPCLELINKYDGPGRLFYFDPPYIVEDEKRMDDINRSYAEKGMDLAAHQELTARLLELQGMGVLSGYDHPVYKPLTDNGWKKIEIPTLDQVSTKDKSKDERKRIEVLWINPALQAANRQKLLF